MAEIMNTRRLGSVSLVDEISGETSSFEVYSEGGNIWDQFKPIYDILIGEFVFIDILLSGWKYDTFEIYHPKSFSGKPVTPYYRGRHGTLMVVAGAGFLDFISSRDKIDDTSRSKSFLQKLGEQLGVEWAKKVLFSLSDEEQFELALWCAIKNSNKNVLASGHNFNKDLYEGFKKIHKLASSPPIKCEFIWGVKDYSYSYSFRYLVAAKDFPSLKKYEENIMSASSMVELLDYSGAYSMDFNHLVKQICQSPKVHIITNVEPDHIKRLATNLKKLLNVRPDFGEGIIVGFAGDEEKFWQENKDYEFAKTHFHFNDVRDVLNSVKKPTQRKTQSSSQTQNITPPDVLRDFAKIGWYKLNVRGAEDIKVLFNVEKSISPVHHGGTIVSDKKAIIVLMFDVESSYFSLDKIRFYKIIHSLLEKYTVDELKNRSVMIGRFQTDSIKRAIEMNNHLIKTYSNHDVYNYLENNDFDGKKSVEKLEHNNLPMMLLPKALLNDENRMIAEMRLFVVPKLQYVRKERYDIVKILNYFEAYQEEGIGAEKVSEFLAEWNVFFFGALHNKVRETYTEICGKPSDGTMRRCEIAENILEHLNYFDSVKVSDEDKYEYAKLLSRYFPLTSSPPTCVREDSITEVARLPSD